MKLILASAFNADRGIVPIAGGTKAMKLMPGSMLKGSQPKEATSDTIAGRTQAMRVRPVLRTSLYQLLGAVLRGVLS